MKEVTTCNEIKGGFFLITLNFKYKKPAKCIESVNVLKFKMVKGGALKLIGN